MAKIFDHAVIYNGVFYPANTPIEVKEPIAEKEAPTGAEPKKATKKAVGKNDKGTD